MSVQLQDSSIDTSELERLFNSMIKTLINDYSFEYSDTLNWDLKGCVVSMKDRQRGVKVAVKIVTERNYDEENLWNKLLHPHVLPLHCCIELHDITMTKAFVTPLKGNSVYDIIKGKEFQNREDSIALCKKWIYQIISGLNYLHEKRIYYLNMRLRNVLISNETNASLCGFKYLTSDKIIEDPSRVGCLRAYRAPEVFMRDKETDRTDEMDSEKIDLWSFGIVSLEIITGHNLDENPNLWGTFSSEWTNWDRHIGRVINEMINDPIKFMTLVKKNYSNVELTNSDIEICLDFLKKFIQKDSTLRMSTELGMKHDYFYPLNKRPPTKIVTTITQGKVPKRYASTSCLHQRFINYAMQENQARIFRENRIKRQNKTVYEKGTQLYDLVLVGHSLGAGTAAILATLLKQEYPNLVCYAYSPPGGLLSC